MHAVNEETSPSHEQFSSTIADSILQRGITNTPYHHEDAPGVTARPSLIERAMPETILEIVGTVRSPSNSNSEQQFPQNSQLNALSGLEPFPSEMDAVSVMVKQLSHPQPEQVSLWNKSRFVRQGLLTAQAAITYADLFYQHIAPFSPVPFQDHNDLSNQERLILREPMLCCTILMIASRFFILPGTGSLLRGQMVHQRLWQHCETMIRRILYGQEKTSVSRMRIVSTIESLLLISDWHPQPILFPIEGDGIDEEPPEMNPLASKEADREHGPSAEWRDYVLEPSRRSDRMSLMMLGTASNLAYEVGIFADDLGMLNNDEVERGRRMRARKLLYVYVANITVRMGCPSGLPQDVVFAASKEAYNALCEPSASSEGWNTICDCWLELVRLHKTASSIFFGSNHYTRKSLLNGQYLTIIQHIEPLLQSWHSKFRSSQNSKYSSVRQLLYIEYQTLRSFIHALSIQAVVERAVARGIQLKSHRDLLSTCFLSQDIDYIREVVASTQEILQTAIAMGSAGTLRLLPTRQSISIVSSSILLLKAISLGVSDSDLRFSLDTLDRCTAAMHGASMTGELDFTARFASLVQEWTAPFRTAFVAPPEDEVTLAQLRAIRGTPLEGVPGVLTTPKSTSGLPSYSMNANASTFMQADGRFQDTDEWWTQPFDPSFAPFSTDGDHISAMLEIDSLDFLWNIPPDSAA